MTYTSTVRFKPKLLQPCVFCGTNIEWWTRTRGSETIWTAIEPRTGADHWQWCRPAAEFHAHIRAHPIGVRARGDSRDD